MRSIAVLAALLGSVASVAGLAIRGPDTTPEGYLIVTPGPVEDMIVSEETTQNGTYQGEQLVTASDDIGLAATIPLRFTNNFGAPLSAYITGLHPNGAACFVNANGGVVFPSSGGSGAPIAINQNDIRITVPAGGSLDVTLPVAIRSGRIYFGSGDIWFGVVGTPAGEGIVHPAGQNPSDPSARVSWGFMEFTYEASGFIFANISYVDFAGLPVGLALAVNGGATQTAYGIHRGAVNDICTGLSQQQSRDGRPWASMCMAGNNGPVRAIAPLKYSEIDTQGFLNYWDSYVNDVWNKYRNEPLTIDTQGGAGRVTCRVSGDTLSCGGGDNRSYGKPNARDIWGCDSGPFGKLASDNAVHLAVIPRLCAAFVRSTLLLAGGNVQPSLSSSSYYTANPTNHYGRVVHANEVDGKGYTFAYDDVNANGENAEGSVSHTNPSRLTVYIGSPP